MNMLTMGYCLSAYCIHNVNGLCTIVRMPVLWGIPLCLMLPVNMCRLYDVPDSDLIKHWEKTYRFIKEAKYVHIDTH